MITWDNSPPVTITKSLSASTLRRRPSWLYVSVCVTHRREYCTVTHPCSADDELSGVSVCPVMNIPMVNCLGLASVCWPEGFCLSSVELPNGELSGVSVQWWTAHGFLSGGELPDGESSGVSVCTEVSCPMVNFGKVLVTWWWTA